MKTERQTRARQDKAKGFGPDTPQRSVNNSLDQTIAAVRTRLDLLQRRATEVPGDLALVLAEAFEEWHITLEELQVADEELRQQNDELILAAQRLEDERRRYQELFDFALHGYLLTDSGAVIQQANHAAAALLAVPPSRLPGKPLVLFVAAEESRAFLTQLHRLLQHESVKDWEVRLQPRGRKPFYAALTTAAVRNSEGHLVALRWLIRDITERKRAEAQAQRAEQALRSSREQLRALATHLQDRQEDERRRIAREIHDELAQVLTVLKLDVAWLSNRRGMADDTARERLQNMATLIETLVTAVRRIGTELRPNILDDLGLTAAIEWQLQEICKRTGMAHELMLPSEDIELEQGRATAIFRIFQEALTNVLRHAVASKISVRMRQRPNLLILEVADNGRGITPEQLSDRRSLGLLSMYERARLWGGDVTIEGKPAEGTVVTLRMPYEASTAGGALS